MRCKALPQALAQPAKGCGGGVARRFALKSNIVTLALGSIPSVLSLRHPIQRVEDIHPPAAHAAQGVEGGAEALQGAVVTNSYSHFKGEFWCYTRFGPSGTPR